MYIFKIFFHFLYIQTNWTGCERSSLTCKQKQRLPLCSVNLSSLIYCLTINAIPIVKSWLFFFSSFLAASYSSFSVPMAKLFLLSFLFLLLFFWLVLQVLSNFYLFIFFLLRNLFQCSVCSIICVLNSTRSPVNFLPHFLL